jgi:LemA protein
MEAIVGFVVGLFWLAFWIVVILGIIALVKYNKLQRLAQEVKEAASNVQVAVSKKIQLVNQLGDVVRSFQAAEQFTQLKVSQDNTAQAMAGAYQQSGQMLASIQSVAARFPELKANEQYHRLADSIQVCERDIEARRNHYNASVKTYNGERSGIPAVFVARAMGFQEAPFLQFDIVSGAEERALRPFETPDGERLEYLLGRAKDGVVGGVKSLTSKASGLTTVVLDRTAEGLARRSYFYLLPGGGPTGPATLDERERLVASGGTPAEVQVALQGTDAWEPLASAAAKARAEAASA